MNGLSWLLLGMVVGLGLALIGAAWWVYLVAFLCLVIVALLTVLQGSVRWPGW